MSMALDWTKISQPDHKKVQIVYHNIINQTSSKFKTVAFQKTMLRKPKDKSYVGRKIFAKVYIQ